MEIGKKGIIGMSYKIKLRADDKKRAGREVEIEVEASTTAGIDQMIERAISLRDRIS